jgi:S-adenosylmethionine hydrolase
MSSAAPIITLTTDFGHKGPFVAVMKGIVLSSLPTARIIDLTHEIHAHWPAEAGFWLARAYQYFPAGTVHVAVVDPGVGTARDIVVAEADQHVFMAPDNGLLPLVLDYIGAAKVFRLSQEWLQQQNWPDPSATFHGRDIFAPLAAAIASGRATAAEIGPPADDLVPSLVEPPELIGGQVRGTVIAIDNFGNLITNIDASCTDSFNQPEAKAAGRSFRFRRTYSQCPPGDFLALINSFGVVEIARAEGSAAESLGLGWGAPVTVAEGSADND